MSSGQPDRLTPDHLVALGAAAIQSGEKLEVVLAIIKRELRDEGFGTFARKAPQIALRNNGLIVDGKRYQVPPKVFALLRTLAREVGVAKNIEELAAGMDSPETSVYPTVSASRELLQFAGLEPQDLLITIKAEKRSGDRASYMWNPEVPVEVD